MSHSHCYQQTAITVSTFVMNCNKEFIILLKINLMFYFFTMYVMPAAFIILRQYIQKLRICIQKGFEERGYDGCTGIGPVLN
jgi:hypothetical protein